MRECKTCAYGWLAGSIYLASRLGCSGGDRVSRVGSGRDGDAWLLVGDSLTLVPGRVFAEVHRDYTSSETGQAGRHEAGTHDKAAELTIFPYVQKIEVVVGWKARSNCRSNGAGCCCCPWYLRSDEWLVQSSYPPPLAFDLVIDGCGISIKNTWGPLLFVSFTSVISSKISLCGCWHMCVHIYL